jgi:hypothetical protein
MLVSAQDFRGRAVRLTLAAAAVPFSSARSECRAHFIGFRPQLGQVLQHGIAIDVVPKFNLSNRIPYNTETTTQKL